MLKEHNSKTICKLINSSNVSIKYKCKLILYTYRIYEKKTSVSMSALCTYPVVVNALRIKVTFKNKFLITKNIK